MAAHGRIQNATTQAFSYASGTLKFKLLILVLLAGTSVAWGQRPQQDRSRRRGLLDISLILMSTGDVQRELDITASQGKLLEAFGEDLRAQRIGRIRNRQRRSAASSEQRAELSKRIFRVLLEDDQFDRLTEISLQFLGPYAIEDEKFTQSVSLTDEQMDAIRSARKEDSKLGNAELEKLIGQTAAQKWMTELGDRFRFRGDLGTLQTEFLRERSRAESLSDRRRRSENE